MAFARQLAERYNKDDDDADGDKKKNKIRTSKPKGSKFAAGYVDRAKMRSEQDAGDDRAARLAALEELHKKGEVEQAVYEKLRFEIAGGDLSSTHLVKGLDFKLLNRVRMGEDVFGREGEEGKEEKAEEDEADDAAEQAALAPDVDDEFEKIEGSEVQAVEREKAKKKGQYSTTAAAGQKRSRDQILAEMKAAREAAKQAKAAAAAAEPVLGSRFKKIGAPQAAGSRIEIDGRGREVLVIVDEDGHEKRKVRRAAAPAAYTESHDAPKPEGKVLGMEVPEFYRKKQEAEAAAAAAKEVDIFEDVGSDYDPLAGMDSGSSDESESDENKDKGKEAKGETMQEKDKDDTDSRDAKRRRRSSTASSREDGEASDASRSSYNDRQRRRRSPRDERKPAGRSAEPTSTTKQRNNYFGGSTLLSEETSRGGPSLDDPSVLAALRKAKQMREATESEAKSQALSQEAEREARLKKLMQSSDRDADDLDMGFGTNRLEDTEDLDEDREGGRKERLSTWRGGANVGGDDDEEGGSRGDKAKRKRGGKKRKGDGNNAEDVMRVLEKRREGGS